MYAKHFGLRQEPFSIAPDPRFLFMSERHREALAHLLYGLQGSGGVVLLTGEIGAGKTTVCRCFLEQIPAKCNVAYIFNPKLTVTELLQTVCDEFRITHDASRAGTVKDYVDAINAFLLRTHAAGQNNVLIIDEAQNLSPDVLEQLRLLTNLETNERKLLQIVLIGQPELRTLLARPEMEQLAQRIVARYHLEALNATETNAYIRHRLVISGRTGGNPFDSTARERVHKLSRGVPRRINVLCDRAMLGAYSRGTQRINAKMIDDAAREVFGPQALRAPWLQAIEPLLDRLGPKAPWIGGGIAAAALVLALVLWALPKRDAPRAAAATGTLAAPATAQPRSNSPSAAPDASAPRIASASDGARPSAPTPTRTSIDAAAEAAGTSQPPPMRLLRDEKQAWRLLALTAHVTLGDGDPCQVAVKQKLACTKRSDATIDQLRRLRQPALLTLRDAQSQPSFVIHTGVADEGSVWVRGDGGDRVKLDLNWLASRWRGEVADFKPVGGPAASPSTTPTP